MGVKKGFTPEQIIVKLRKAEVLMSKRATLADVCRKIGVTDVTFYRWRGSAVACRFPKPRGSQTREPIGERL